MVVVTLQTLRQPHENALFVEAAATKLSYGLGLVALFLTTTGLHGIVIPLFARRTKEFAIRLAMGAAPVQMVAAVLSSGLRLTGVGLATGLALGVPLALFAAAKSEEMTQWPLSALGLSAVIVFAAAPAAAARPAWRALRIQPAEVLRAN